MLIIIHFKHFLINQKIQIIYTYLGITRNVIFVKDEESIFFKHIVLILMLFLIYAFNLTKIYHKLYMKSIIIEHILCYSSLLPHPFIIKSTHLHSLIVLNPTRRCICIYIYVCTIVKLMNVITLHVL